MAIELSTAAAARMRDFLARNPAAVGVRFGVKRTGCSGFSYRVDLAPTVTAADQVFELDGVTLVVAAGDLPLLDGTRIDYAHSGVNSAFVFANPNATAACGCGESFTVAAGG